MRGLGTALALLLVFAISLSACGFGAVSPEPTPDQLLRLAFRNLEKSSSYRVQGTYTSVIPRVDVDVTAVHPLGARGSIVDDTKSAKLSFVYRDGKTYFSGTSIPGMPGKLGSFLAGKWVYNSTTENQLEPLVSTRKLASPVLLEVAFLVGQASVRSKPVTYGGKKAVTLFNAAERVTVTAGANPQLLKIERPVGSAPQDGFTEVNLDFGEYSRVTTLDVPGSPLDLADPTVLPAKYVGSKETLAILPCDPMSCGARVTVTNTAGSFEPTPAAFVTIRVTRKSDGSLIDSCTAPIPLIPHGATEDVACQVTGGAWQSFVRGGGGHYDAAVTISNPLYD